MSWLLQLYETYQSNLGRVGEVEKKHNELEFTLLPISHTTQTAHIEVNVTENGEFHSAKVLEKVSTLIPCTEESASRSSGIAPYPLHDKLSYVAGDFVAYGGAIKKEEPFSYYIKQLEEWALSSHGHPKIKAIYTYLQKQQLIKDLVEHRILFLDANQSLISKWDKEHEKLHGEKPPIFKYVVGGQESAFVRFNVYSPERILTEVWRDKEVYQSFIRYYQEQIGDREFCYVTGKNVPSTERHANKIRNSADKAKLISANDTSGFTFRGRFYESKDATSISYDVSQKAHNALKWLINRQGKVIDQRVFLVWTKEGELVPDTTMDSFALFSSPQKDVVKTSTNPEFSKEVAKALDGYKNNLEIKADVNILVLDAATTGRLAVLYYRNLDKEVYFNKLKKWHSACVWLHSYRKHGDEFVQFWGAPATKDIAFAAYGSKANEKVVKGLMERMLPCIIDERDIPLDIVRSAIQRSCNPISMDKWEWEKTLSITCALINKKEEYQLALDQENNDRDYLFGRLLAIADVLERRALGPEENRATNAIRYMNSFSKHPARTWMTIQSSLQPYQAKLGTSSLYLSKLIDEVATAIPYEEFNNKPLSGKYLLGFYSQRHDLYQKKEKVEQNEILNGKGE